MRKSSLVLGILILLGCFSISNQLSPQQQAQLRTKADLCNSGLGSIAGALSSNVAQGCQDINTQNTIFNLLPFGYLIGIGFLLAGLFSSENTQSTSKPVRQKKNEDKTVEDPALSILKKRYAKGQITRKEFLEMKKQLE